jgi:hypothetical protein
MRSVVTFICLLCAGLIFSQSEIKYGAETFASAGFGEYTPFWTVSNTRGMVPLRQNNAYLRGNIFYENTVGKNVKVEAGMDVTTALRHSSDIWIHQLFADISYKKLQLTAGMKEYYNSFLDKELSQGDMCFSLNARPRPEIILGTDEYVYIPATKGFLKFKADFAVGKSLEDDYVLRVKNATTNYAQGVLYHHKSLFLLWENSGRTPFAFTFGIVHAAQWGGSIYEVRGGQATEVGQPSSFSDFVRIVECREGDENATASDRANVLGNHLGTMNARLDYRKAAFEISAYKQHYFEDNSGLEYANWRDGIWGAELKLNKIPHIEKVTFEYLNTTNNSGPFHFIKYDDRAHYRGGGADSYYNHAYSGGWSYFGRALGNPLLTSPEYNGDGSLGFKNNRIKSHHLGVRGKISNQFSYRCLLTEMKSWGTQGRPQRKNNFSGLWEITYEPARWNGWKIGLQAATDVGDIYGNNTGLSLKIGKAN